MSRVSNTCWESCILIMGKPIFCSKGKPLEDTVAHEILTDFNIVVHNCP